jgi:hypothetical protein
MTELEFKLSKLHDLELLEISVQELPEVIVCNMLPKITTSSIAKEFGYTDDAKAGTEYKRRSYIGTKRDINPSFIDDQNGVTIEMAAEMIYGILEDYGSISYDFVRQTIMDILFAGSKKNYLKTFTLAEDIAKLKREIDYFKKYPNILHVEESEEFYDPRIQSFDLEEIVKSTFESVLSKRNDAREHKSQYPSIGFFNALYQFYWPKQALPEMVKKIKRPIHWRGTIKPRFLFVDLPPKRVVSNPPSQYKKKVSDYSATITKQEAIAQIHDLFSHGTQKKTGLTRKEIQFLINYVSAGVIKYFINETPKGTKSEYTWILLGKNITLYSILMECTKEDLQVICYKVGAITSGNKSDIAQRLIKYV